VQHGTEKAPINVAARGAADEVVISVRNDGPVIPKEEVGLIFKPGRHTGPGTAQDEHLGLGLFIVDRIVAAHGGTVDVRSTKEDGTTFTVHLPRAA
jgi:signal transduction histidine kinase